LELEFVSLFEHLFEFVVFKLFVLILENFVLEDSVDNLSISGISDPLCIDLDGLFGPEGIKELTLLRNELLVRGVFGVVLPLLIEEACDDDGLFINGNDVDESL
jgi:hypothetical protein